MGKKPTIEHRVVCARFGTAGHSQHYSTKTGTGARAKAIKSVKEANDHARRSPQGHWYKGEAPYRRQQREVSAWEDSE